MKLIINWLISTVAILVTAYILPGIHLGGLIPALVLAIILAAINISLKPIFQLLTFPITIVTLGLWLLVINALMIMLAAAIVPGFEVAGFWWALLFSIILSIITSVLHLLAREGKSVAE
jgi:putative membrane protein